MQKLFLINDSNFQAQALVLFRHQAEYNHIYRAYLSTLDVDVQGVDCIERIPFLPISFFKTQVVKTGAWQEEKVYESSGTTGKVTSRHFVHDNDFYLANTVHIFERFYGPLTDYHCLFLLPGYLERGHSSLVAMAAHFIEKSNSESSGFYLYDFEALRATLEHLLEKGDRKILLCGVTFALLDFAQHNPLDLSGVTLMETGGMKGRRKEMVRAEVHNILRSAFHVTKIHSEYGMTELTSQAYALRDGHFQTPPWMKFLLRDVNDPFDVSSRTSGGINVVDLANVHSCAFIETQDLGAYASDGRLEILGRFDNSDVRGCNLLV